MKEIYKNLFIGDDSDCFKSKYSDYAVIHACKTCHQKALHYLKSLPNIHPHYLIYEKDNHLYLNMVDMRELLSVYTNPIMQSAMRFIDLRLPNEKVLVHCNQGFSRSPSIVLIYMALKELLSDNSYTEAKSEFIKIYPSYLPGIGLELYLAHNWSDLMKQLLL
jgi:predicted protein tyrosine phosphatase